MSNQPVNRNKVKNPVSIFQIEEKITLNTWDDITNRPYYISPVEPKKSHYIRITAVYSFKEQSAQCSVSDCLKAHSQGFLVITSNDKETNLCEDCGRRFFGVTFKDQKKALQEQGPIRKQQIRLNAILNQSDEIKSRIKELKQAPYGANWLYLSLTNFRMAYPSELLSALKELAANKEDNAILSALIENNDSSCIEQVEQLQGLGIFATDIREVLIENVLKPLKQLEEYAANPGSKRSLAAYCRWAEGLDDQFARAEQLVEEGHAFFNRENLERLKSIPLPEKSARLTRSIHWDYDKSKAKRK